MKEDIFNRKVLVIGLDGASWNLFNKVLEKDMPYLKNLIQKGATGSLRSTIPPISPAAWATIQTGRSNLNDHIYEFKCFNKESKEIKIVNSKFLKNSIWEILSSVGKKVAVVNVPMTYPPKKVNGYIIGGVLTPSLKSNFTFPHKLKKEVLRRIPNYQLHYAKDTRYGLPHNNIEEFIQNRVKNIKDRANVCVWLLNNFNIDMLMVNFQANDILQHVLWGYLNEDSDLYNEKIERYTFKNFHRTLDFCIEAIREEYIRNNSENILTVILSDHGFEIHKKTYLLGDWLRQKGLLVLNDNSIVSPIKRKIKNLILDLDLKGIQSKGLNLLKKLEGKKPKIQQNSLSGGIIDWKRTKVYAMGISLYGLLFILGERKEKAILLKYLEQELSKLRDTENGKKIVDKIYSIDDLYKGTHLELMPDLIIKPKKGYSFTTVLKNSTNLLQKIEVYKDKQIGKHSEEGILVLNGPGVKSMDSIKASLEDIVPSILHFFGIPAPTSLDGNVIGCFK